MRLPSLRLGGLELRRFARARLTRIAIAGLVLLPLLYAGLYLWSFWDPYARLSHVPVALVVDDRPATADGRTVTAGADLAKELRHRRVFDWHVVNAAQARNGVASGRYYLSLTVPADFSARIAAPAGGGTLEPAALRVELNDANNYVVGSIADAAFKEISAAAGGTAVKKYFDDIFVSFGTLRREMSNAADGAGRLASGAGDARTGAGTLHDGLGTAASGGRELSSGLGTLSQSTESLASGSRQVAAGMERLNGTVNKYSDKLVPVLRDNAAGIHTASLAVAEGADAVARNADRLPARTAAAVRGAEQAYRDLDAYLTRHPEIPANERTLLRSAARNVVTIARQVDGHVQAHTRDLAKISKNARVVATDARKLAKDAPYLAQRVQRAREDVNRLNGGTRRVASGAAQVDQGATQAHAASVRLAAGLGRLDSGAGTLEQGIGGLATGAGTLSDGLHDGATQVPAYGDDERGRRSDMMSEPVRLASATDNKAPNYGTGFAPFFVPLSLWVGAMVIYMLLRPLSPRALAGTTPAWRVAVSGWLPATLIGVLQSLVVVGVLRAGLGLEARHWTGLVIFLALAAAAFVAVVQFVNARFGPVGKILALVLLMLQLTSAAGTYPIETSPGFFQAIQPFLPMPWVVRGLRHLISGGTLDPVWQGGAVLAVFLVGGLVLTNLAARRNRVWTLTRLHPVLKL